MIQTTHTTRRVTTNNAGTVDDALNTAIKGLIPPAIMLKHGIRVTRIGPGDYLVETTPDIACGYTICEYR